MSNVIQGDCLDEMGSWEPESVDAIVTDPPYGLGFMGKTWDHASGSGMTMTDVWDATMEPVRTSPMRRRAEHDAVNTGASKQGGRQRQGDDYQRRQARDARSFQEWCETWATAAFRVAKPGAHLLAFGGTRTVHRLTSAIEDAGWEIRDCLVWGYASGFPKSHNLDGDREGWGTALKPAWEPIVMARKPLRGTVAANVAEHGTGALNIDGTRIEGAMKQGRPQAGMAGGFQPGGTGQFRVRDSDQADPSGRWPANVILTDPIFDGGIEGVVGGGSADSGYMEAGTPHGLGYGGGALGTLSKGTYGDSGTYSRFFLIPKADRAEREPIAGTMPRVTRAILGQGIGGTDNLGVSRANVHPTVKPVDLMRHLVRLVTPPGGIVLDPFLGSGTTGIACEMEGFDWIGIEREAEYVAIAEARLHGVQKGMALSA